MEKLYFKVKSVKEFLKEEREQAELKRRKPINRAKKINGDGWYIPSMNSRRYTCEINRMHYKKTSTPRARGLMTKDRMQERNIKVNF